MAREIGEPGRDRLGLGQRRERIGAEPQPQPAEPDGEQEAVGVGEVAAGGRRDEERLGELERPLEDDHVERPAEEAAEQRPGVGPGGAQRALAGDEEVGAVGRQRRAAGPVRLGVDPVGEVAGVARVERVLQGGIGGEPLAPVLADEGVAAEALPAVLEQRAIAQGRQVARHVGVVGDGGGRGGVEAAAERRGGEEDAPLGLGQLLPGAVEAGAERAVAGLAAGAGREQPEALVEARQHRRRRQRRRAPGGERDRQRQPLEPLHQGLHGLAPVVGAEVEAGRAGRAPRTWRRRRRGPWARAAARRRRPAPWRGSWRGTGRAAHRHASGAGRRRRARSRPHSCRG
ncbi:MAG: hypothetical protein R3F59_13840 [Myxococcota bacterium]